MVAQIAKQLTYQKELKFVMQSDQKMKTAERDINRAVYAFMMLKDAGFKVQNATPLGPHEVVDEGEESKEPAEPTMVELPNYKTLEGRRERVLISHVHKDKYEGWHPTLGEFTLFVPKPQPKQDAP